MNKNIAEKAETAQDQPAQSFEQAYQLLADTVAKLEDGELNLDDTMSAFERGVQLAKFCNSLLDQAELKVQQLLENDDGLVITDFTGSGRLG